MHTVLNMTLNVAPKFWYWFSRWILSTLTHRSLFQLQNNLPFNIYKIKSNSTCEKLLSSMIWQFILVCCLVILCLNVSTTPITAMGCRQCLPLSVVQLKGKHCRKPHCRNGVVNTFGPGETWYFTKLWDTISNSKCDDHDAACSQFLKFWNILLLSCQQNAVIWGTKTNKKRQHSI